MVNAPVLYTGYAPRWGDDTGSNPVPTTMVELWYYSSMITITNTAAEFRITKTKNGITTSSSIIKDRALYEEALITRLKAINLKLKSELWYNSSMENNNTYTATTVRFSSQGEKLEEVRDFANDWNGFKEASKFVEGADEYAIWYEDKIIDFSK